jgi:hypothetical protein
MRLQELGLRFPDLAFYRLRRSGGDGGILEMVDEDDIVLRSGPAADILEEVATRAEARKVASVFLELAGWPADRAEAFRAASARFAEGRRSAWTLAPVIDRPGWLGAGNPLFARGADWEEGDTPLEPVPAGPYRGWHRLTFRFLVSAGGGTVSVPLHVMARSPEAAARLREAATQAFRAKLFIAYSPLSALLEVVAEFRGGLPPAERRGIRIVEDAAGLFDLG